MEAVRLGVVEQERKRITGNEPSPDACWVEGTHSGVVQPLTGIFTGLRVACEQDDGLISEMARRLLVSRDLVHAQVFMAKQPSKRDIVNGFLPRDGAAEYPRPD